MSLNNKNLIELDLEDDFIQVRLTTNEYAHNESLSYYYRVDENANWISTNKIPIINLSYLPRGTEYIYVKVINDDDINSQSTIKIPVIIKTKIYKEWWFIPSILFVFITLLLLVLIQTNRVRNIKAKKVDKLKSEEILLQNLGKQKELNSLKTKFIRLVSHEYRTPLTGIATSLDLMDMLLANSTSDVTIVKEKRHMKNIRLQVDRMSKLIKGVQSLNRMEDFIAKMNMEEGDIAAYVKYHIELLVPNDFTFKFHSNSETILTTFDKDIMLQILSNIVSNSVKYSFKERKELIVNCEILSDNTYTIVIQDFGVGIPEKDLPLVFDTFYRSQAIENIQGIGLGLSITKQLIEQMNGTIEIHSILDYGTTVSIKFPMSEA
jgi:signal transduction histidine kinase